MSFTSVVDELKIFSKSKFLKKNGVFNYDFFYNAIYDKLFLETDGGYKAKCLLRECCLLRYKTKLCLDEHVEIIEGSSVELDYFIPVFFHERQAQLFLKPDILRDYKRQYLWIYEVEEQSKYDEDADEAIFQTILNTLISEKEAPEVILASVGLAYAVKKFVTIYAYIQKQF